MLNEKKFLSAWMIVSFPEFVLGKTKKQLANPDNYPDDVYMISKSMIEKLTGLTDQFITNEQIRQFNKNFSQYSNAINYFLERDRLEQLGKAIGEYIDVVYTLQQIQESKTINENVKSENTEIINGLKNKIYMHIFELDNTIVQNDLELYSEACIIKEKRINDLGYIILLNDIKTKKMCVFPKMIDDIRNDLVALGAKKTNDGNNIETILDTDFLNQLIVNINSFQNEDVFKYGDYIINIINKLQAPVSIEDTKNKWDELKSIENLDQFEYLAKMLFFVTCEIYNIKNTIVNLVAMNVVGINMLDFTRY